MENEKVVNKGEGRTRPDFRNVPFHTGGTRLLPGLVGMLRTNKWGGGGGRKEGRKEGKKEKKGNGRQCTKNRANVR